MCRCAGALILDQAALPPELQKEFRVLALSPSGASARKTLQLSLDEYEVQILREALAEHRWNQSEAARTLGISERAMRYKMERLRIVRRSRH